MEAMDIIKLLSKDMPFEILNSENLKIDSKELNEQINIQENEIKVTLDSQTLQKYD